VGGYAGEAGSAPAARPSPSPAGRVSCRTARRSSGLL